MKPLAMVSLFVMLASAGAQQIVPCDKQVRFGYRSLDLISFDRGNEIVLASAYLTTPAKFPDPAKTDYVVLPYEYNCNGVVASSTHDEFKIEGPISKILPLVVSPFRGDGGSFEATPNAIVLAYAGGYVYPNIRQDWYQARVFFTLDNGQIKLAYEPYGKLLDQVAIGVKVDGGDIQPLFFNNTLTPVKANSGSLVEMFLKGEHRAFDYIGLDFGRGVITIRNGVPFPAN